CEYPDAPPNLSDLSQKVLTLYDSLRELEGEFLVKYMQNMDQVVEPASDTEGEESLLVALDTHEDITIEEPAGWSMSFGPSGLCLQAVTRNLYEYRKFIQTLSQQLARDFGPDYLPKKWDPDAEGYGEEFEQEELDEDEYLLTVPISSLMTLLLANPSVEQYKTCGIMPIFVEMHKTHMVQHLQLRTTTRDYSGSKINEIITESSFTILPSGTDLVKQVEQWENELPEWAKWDRDVIEFVLDVMVELDEEGVSKGISSSCCSSLNGE
ncbi:hypothetical protein CU098_003806, partial [Rhizopus stolonifer]